MRIAEVISFLEAVANPTLQESYDNAGLITGNGNWNCSGIICSLDATEEVILEAVKQKCNLIVAHHPIIFGGLKKINGNNYVEKTIIAAIKNDIAIYAIHTNLDNVLSGVNGRIAKELDLINCTILSPKVNTLCKLYTYAPVANAQDILEALFAAGGGNIGKYSECSFSLEGSGTFKPGTDTTPFLGKEGERHTEQETKIEIIFPAYLQNKILAALIASHPYEEVAYEVIPISNSNQEIGSGLIGELKEGMEEKDFLDYLKRRFAVPVVRHTVFLGKPIKKVALCGGAGSFLIYSALEKKADIFITADIKYHEFFDANGKMLLIDMGHYESEQFTINLLQELLAEKFPTFAVLKTAIKTNPVYYC